MCGRYSLIKQEQELKQFYIPEYIDLEGYRPNYNAAPMQTMPVVTNEGLELMTWGLVPSWAKEFRPSFTTINARGETVAEKPLYRTPFKKRRILVPATGFYEWQKRGNVKQPYHIRPLGDDIFSFAGLYDIWYDAADKPHKSFSIITTRPNEQMSEIHDRMPVILERSEEKYWLEPSANPADLQLMLNPFENELELYEVDRAVGSIKNNYPELLEPLGTKLI
jgi:putative SOS response-associated peptidase YedK